MERKTRSDALTAKITPDQKSQLIDWLARHPYSEVIELAQAEPPEGLGLEISRSALGRFYQTHLTEIDLHRQENYLDQCAEHNRLLNFNEHMRYNFHQSATLRLQEHLCRRLAQPVESSRELKTLAHIGKLIATMGVDLGNPGERTAVMQQIANIQKLFVPQTAPAPGESAAE